MTADDRDAEAVAIVDVAAAAVAALSDKAPAAELVELVEPQENAGAARPGRPTFTVTGAAAATGKSRRTIGRMLDAGELVGAHRDDTGAWSIPAEALLGAGLQLHAPTPPGPVPPPPDSAPQEPHGRAREAVPAAVDAEHLRAELADWRRRAEVAEAIAAERAHALDDVRAALALAQRMLPAGPTPSTTSPPPAPAPRRRLFSRRPRPAPAAPPPAAPALDTEAQP